MDLITDKTRSDFLAENNDHSSESEQLTDEVFFQEQDIAGPSVRYGYQAGRMKFAVPDGAVSELVQSNKIYHLPNAPKWICGLMNVHGNVVPVADIVSLIGDEISHLSKSRILSIKNKDEMIGVLIDGLPEAISDYEQEPGNVADECKLPQVISKFSTGSLISNGVTWQELDIFGLLSELALLQDIKND